MFRNIAIRFLILLFVLAGCNLLYSVFVCRSDFKKYNPILYRCENISKQYDVIYLGESSNMTFAENDSTTKKISELLGYYRPDLSLHTIDTFAVHAGIYAEWIRNVSVLPKAFIITMNLRSFNSSWINSTMETQLQKSIRMKQTWFCGVNRFLMSLNGLNDKSNAEREIDVRKGLKRQKINLPDFPYKNAYEWDHKMAEKIRLRSYKNKEDSLRIVLACHYIKSFAFTLDESNPRIRDFDKIVEFCKKNNVKIYFNLLPENTGYADSLAGKELVELMRRNRDFLIKRYDTPGIKVMDLMETLDESLFIDLNWTTEHYRDRGRMIIAKRLSDGISL